MITHIVQEAAANKQKLLHLDVDRPLLRESGLRCITINTHRGRGPKLPYLLRNASPAETERIELMHETRTYTYFIADWINKHRHRFDVVALQEVFMGIFGVGERIRGKYRQRDHYRVFAGYKSFVEHGVGFAAFRYQNLLLSHLPLLAESSCNYLLPGKVAFLASCGFTLAPFLYKDSIVWVGNTHLHAYHPKKREKQARSIAEFLAKLGDVPVVFLGDMNTVPPGCTDSGFSTGEPDYFSYKDDRSLHILQDAGLRIVGHEDDERFYTYPTGAPNRTLDYIMYSKHWEVRDYRVIDDFLLSDHYPVYAELDLILHP